MSRFRILFFIVASIFIISCGNKNENNSEKPADSLSIDQLTKSIHESPNDGNLFFIRAKKYYENRQLNEAIADLNSALMKADKKPEHYTLLAEYYLNIGQSENSKDILEKAIKAFPKNTEALLKLSQLHFFVKQYKQALDYLNKVQEIDENISQIYFIRGLVLEESGDTVNAIKNFQISTEKNPNYYEAYIILGLRYTDKKDSLAISYFKNAVKIRPNSAEAVYNMALFYQKTGKMQKAVNLYEEVITKIDSSYKYAYYNLGYIHLTYFKEYPKAAMFFNKAVELDGKYFQAWYNLGLANESMKDYKKAKAYYKQALIIEPEFEIAFKALKRVDKK